MMTLDEAIRRERRAMRQESGERSEEHRQVAEWLRTLREMLDGAWDVTLENCDLKAEIARYGELTRILDREWNIEVGWDGVRRVWNVALTELGVRLRDEREAVRAAYIDTVKELEDENAKLREQGARLFDKTLELGTENAKLRELIFDMLVDEERGSTEENTYYEHVRLAKGLGI